MRKIVAVLAIVSIPAVALAPPPLMFVRGNANSDGVLDIADPVFILNFLFLGGPSPACTATADANDDGVLNIADPVYILNFLFLGGAPPPQPFPDCGPDPTIDELGCDSYPACF